jgi:NAD(P)-dependent dehydrogenase (short-subunit alcohol dehydrogenase family)
MMRAKFGRIISVTSVVGVTGNPGQVNYAASKAGLIGLSKALAQEVASRNITVNTIAPGFIQSAMTDQLPDAQREALLGRIPAGKLGMGSDIAGGRGLPGQPRGGLRHRGHPPRKWRNGDDLNGWASMGRPPHSGPLAPGPSQRLGRRKEPKLED